MMIIKGNKKTYNNWFIISSEIIAGLKYSMDMDTNRNRCADRYSLDTVLGGRTINTTGHHVSAARLIKLLGKDTFKSMIEYNWQKKFREKDLDTFGEIKIRHLVSGFNWALTKEGYGFWSSIRNKLMEEEL